MTYDKIPAMIVPDNSYVPVLDKKFNGKYTIKEDINNPYNSIIYPRRGIYYDTSKGFTSDHNGKVTVFINDKRQKVDMIELLEENDELLCNIYHKIEFYKNRLIKERYERRMINENN